MSWSMVRGQGLFEHVQRDQSSPGLLLSLQEGGCDTTQSEGSLDLVQAGRQDEREGTEHGTSRQRTTGSRGRA